MGHDGQIQREAVNLSLPSDLLGRARACTGDLNGTLEELLAAYVARQEARQMPQARIDEFCAAMNAFYAEHGTIGDDLSEL